MSASQYSSMGIEVDLKDLVVLQTGKLTVVFEEIFNKLAKHHADLQGMRSDRGESTQAYTKLSGLVQSNTSGLDALRAEFSQLRDKTNKDMGDLHKQLKATDNTGACRMRTPFSLTLTAVADHASMLAELMAKDKARAKEEKGLQCVGYCNVSLSS